MKAFLIILGIILIVCSVFILYDGKKRGYKWGSGLGKTMFIAAIWLLAGLGLIISIFLK